MPETINHDDFLASLRSALHYLYDLNQLRRSPLARQFGVPERVDTPAVLQRILIDAVDAMKPSENEPPQARAWRIYDALYYRYIQRFERDVVADQLGISGRQFRREQLAALEALAAYLWKKFNLDPNPNAPAETASPPPPAASQSNQELAWIKENPTSHLLNLDQIVAGSLDLVQPLAQQAQTRIEYTPPTQIYNLALPEVVFRNILLNLLSAAIQRARGGSLQVALTDQAEEITVRITCGCTANPAPLPEKEKASLDMAKQLAELCGGRLVLALNAPGFDAALIFPKPEQVQILVVDDNADALQLFQRYATGTRYAVITTREPAQAYPLARKYSPRAVLLDVMMPDVDGWEVLGHLRQNPGTSHIPVAVCTILPQEELARSLGANAFLQKPVSRDDFLRILDELVGFLSA